MAGYGMKLALRITYDKIIVTQDFIVLYSQINSHLPLMRRVRTNNIYR